MAARKYSSRADELRELGMEVLRARFPRTQSPWGSHEWALETGTVGHQAVIAAVAVMLAAVELPRGRRAVKAPADVAKLAFSPNALYQELRTRVPHLVVCEPVQHRLFGHLGAQLKGMSGLEPQDCERVVSWIEAGGLASWTVQPVFAHVVQNIGKFIGYAREWDRRGRQQLGKGRHNVGLPVAQASE